MIGENALAFSELQTICFEVANLVNERPIGRHPTSPDGTYLCPNDLLYLVDQVPESQVDPLWRRQAFVKYLNLSKG